MKYVIFIILMVMAFNAKSTHIVGGEITYRCLGGNTYQFTVFVYRDCINGSNTALAEDDPLHFAIYNGANQLILIDSVTATRVNAAGLPDPSGVKEFFVPTNFNNDCINNAPSVCNSRLRFDYVASLPNNTSGYYFVYQRCCRNNIISNLLNSGTIGASYYCFIPPNTQVTCNNSAVFKNFPPLIICANNPFFYDHSATDADGDSLSYELCNALEGANQQDPNPIVPDAPPFSTVNYKSPYTPTNPMGGNPTISIDPVTGEITGTPNLQGAYIVAICCSEWRGGVKINTITREFQFVVTNCSKTVIANIPTLVNLPSENGLRIYNIQCDGYDVSFINTSTGGFSYFWDFGVPSLNNDTSNVFNPTYTYPDTGAYVVKLIVNRGSTCVDSIQRLVKVYPYFNSNFGISGRACPDSLFSFIDSSTTTYGVVNLWKWDFGNKDTSTLQNPTYIYQDAGAYNVTLISQNSLGCRDTSNKTININPVNLSAGLDTTIVVNNSATLHGSGAVSYLWTPPTFLNDPTLKDPTGFYPTVGTYPYILTGLTGDGCYVEDTVKVTVTTGPQFIVPNAFSPNGDGINDVLKIIMSGYKELLYFRIFDRWGKQIFYTTNFRHSWDGTSRGEDCEMGVYFWTASGKAVDNTVITIKGDVTLVK